MIHWVYFCDIKTDPFDPQTFAVFSSLLRVDNIFLFVQFSPLLSHNVLFVYTMYNVYKFIYT